jgi:hypothetical protein
VGELGRGALLGRARRPHKGGAGGALGEREGLGLFISFLFIFFSLFLLFFFKTRFSFEFVGEEISDRVAECTRPKS